MDFQEKRNYPKDPGRENQRRVIPKKKEKNQPIANSKSKLRETQIKAIMKTFSKAQTKGSFHVLSLITSAKTKNVVPRVFAGL